MVLYRKANLRELPQITKICTQAYQDYPLFHILSSEFKSKNQYIKFLASLERIYAKTFIKRKFCLVGVEEQQIISVAMLQTPSTKPAGILEYLINGGLSVFKYANLRLVKAFLDLIEQTEAARVKIVEPDWYLANLVVNPKVQGKHLGSDMLQSCVLPFVKKNRGKILTFNTNTEQNSKFYHKNDFIEFDHRILTWKEQKLENWSFVMYL
ncbi:MAG: GNAT family N-acetyltransferase [Liquorilactobacillus nagelii]|jgi:ribosomal protein S18 acetylase RimI-like enzyme|uniref:N-acetyltransferase domain-containing protein n=1 Tax=Liquorilactobacillus nagelii TaxID=82688 RepID=A0A3Q8CGL1_9LACO|nr:GNAT family N-acetyltransferase [Liquorilactobacillus nagelii]AUJ32140.1 hypothetical protein BSQ50_05960 [Liquorilactobacillus nagelii]MCC7615304.1 hypothetical protein [Liquorilactobacillus nagelii]MCP9315447.1 GNAT family N-acetyltransferase [Liquorilactobacillus nagelii]